MIRTGELYRAGLRDDREVWIDGERVKDVAAHPSLKPIVDIRARIYDMQHEAAFSGLLTYREDNKQEEGKYRSHAWAMVADLLLLSPRVGRPRVGMTGRWLRSKVSGTRKVSEETNGFLPDHLAKITCPDNNISMQLDGELRLGLRIRSADGDERTLAPTLVTCACSPSSFTKPSTCPCSP